MMKLYFLTHDAKINGKEHKHGSFVEIEEIEGDLFGMREATDEEKKLAKANTKKK